MKKFILAAGTMMAAVSAYAQPGTFVNLGTIGNTSNTYAIPDLTAGITFTTAEVQWFRFSINFSASTPRYLDIDTSQAMGFADMDTEIGLYSSTGALIATNDDSGSGLYSLLSFGDPGPRGPVNTVGTATGQNGNLASGLYWLACTRFDGTFGATNWNVVGSGSGTNTGLVNFRTNIEIVPEPATMIGLGAAFAALVRRRRR